MLLVGSMPFDTVEEVFRECGSILGDSLASLPDGEVGDRRNWTEYLALRTFALHEALEEVQRPKGGRIPVFLDRSIASGGALDLEGLTWHFRLKPGVSELSFDDLHYAAEAIDSYRIFRRLRSHGVIPAHVRFQVGFPASSSAIEEYFSEPGDWTTVKRAYESAVRCEIDRLLEVIPPNDLAIQYDFSNEVVDLAMGDVPAKYWLPRQSWEEKFTRHTESLAQLWRGIPDETMLGYHWCYGTWGGWPRIAMPDLGLCVALSNEAVARSERRVDYVHMPVIRRAGAEFFAPLKDLDIGGAKVFLGLIHHDDEPETFRTQLAFAAAYLDDFGIAGPCGYGRVPSEELPKVMSTHAYSRDELRRSRAGRV
ncbi:MAG: hypothetical protein M3454_13085 [Actinomycetota bacterium]|nr:hypothetical protein [Actinomycetota bacterium]